MNGERAVWDDANVFHLKAQTIGVLLDAGFTPRSAVAAVESGDLNALAHKDAPGA